ncbi:MAG TPA: 16S rRNA (guanine(527)-N(7))-methyltransferase RsmG [Candidatus Eisenbacteria bacterium]|nr:16S rRNA (guanine(527)-N(7))-methyltransferase RsmG [Candidatus Eisenbacteria bacterium]
MPSASGGGRASVPADLEADFAALRVTVLPWLATLPGNESEQRLEILRQYGLLVHERAARLSLIAQGDRPVLFTRHVLDSLNLATCTNAPPASLLDIGSGAGFPGIPLAIVWPETRVTLLESRDRKAGFLEQAVRQLGLRHVRVVCDRLERVSQDRSIDPVGAVTVRAVGDLPNVLALAEPLAAPGAWWAYFLGGGTGEGEARGRIPEGRVEAGNFGGRILRGYFRHAAP